MKNLSFFFICLLIVGCKEKMPEYKQPTRVLTQITYSDGMNTFPCLFTERWLAFSSNLLGNFDIYIKDNKENTLIQRTQGEENELFPAFSKDGQKIAFSSNRFGSYDIFIIDAFKSGNIQQITFDNGSNEVSPDFSPDGKMLVFCKLFSGKGIISLVDLKTGLITELVSGLYPKFSPKGDKIVFQKDGKIWMLEMSTYLLKEIVQYDNLSCLSPQFSPDGRKIVYVTGSKETGCEEFLGLCKYTPIDIRIINIDGTGDTKITEDIGPDGFPVWSQDNYIYFSSLRNGKNNFNINIFRIAAEE
ncbi:MAG: hypothetical protein AB1630_04840 [bacterium]